MDRHAPSQVRTVGQLTARPSTKANGVIITRERQGHEWRQEGPERDVRVEFPGVFIRAPRFVRVGEGVEVLGWLGEEPVMVRAGRVLSLTFHPELTRETLLHRYFLALAGE